MAFVGGAWMQPYAHGVALSVAFVCASVLFLVWLACRAIDEYCLQRDATLEGMRRFAQAFIREFERPLRQSPFLDVPMRTCIRASPERGRLKVFLAPNAGRRYPNLSDHKTNVMYDVARVLGALDEHPFVCEAIFSSGDWVVIRFQLQRPDGGGAMHEMPRRGPQLQLSGERASHEHSAS
jgi:hypothetical protein